MLRGRATADDYFAYRTKVSGSAFYRCYFGVSIGRAATSAQNLVGTRWLLSGCVLSNLTAAREGAVPVELAGTPAQRCREPATPRREREVALLTGLMKRHPRATAWYETVTRPDHGNSSGHDALRREVRSRYAGQRSTSRRAASSTSAWLTMTSCEASPSGT